MICHIVLIGPGGINIVAHNSLSSPHVLLPLSVFLHRILCRPQIHFYRSVRRFVVLQSSPFSAGHSSKNKSQKTQSQNNNKDEHSISDVFHSNQIKQSQLLPHPLALQIRPGAADSATTSSGRLPSTGPARHRSDSTSSLRNTRLPEQVNILFLRYLLLRLDGNQQRNHPRHHCTTTGSFQIEVPRPTSLQRSSCSRLPRELGSILTMRM